MQIALLPFLDRLGRQGSMYCENTVSRKCEYGVLEITSDTKVSSHKSKTSDRSPVSVICFSRVDFISF